MNRYLLITLMLCCSSDVLSQDQPPKKKTTFTVRNNLFIDEIKRPQLNPVFDSSLSEKEKADATQRMRSDEKCFIDEFGRCHYASDEFKEFIKQQDAERARTK